MGQIVSELVLSGFTPQKYNKTLKELESAGLSHPKGRLYYVAVEKDRGMLILGVWESEKDFNEFSKSFIPILERNGVRSAKPTLLPVYNILH